MSISILEKWKTLSTILSPDHSTYEGIDFESPTISHVEDNMLEFTC